MRRTAHTKCSLTTKDRRRRRIQRRITEIRSILGNIRKVEGKEGSIFHKLQMLRERFERSERKDQATKSIGRMPRHQAPKKDVAGCEKLRGAASEL